MTKNKDRVPQMRFLEKHPLTMTVVGIAGTSLSAIFVKYSQAPSVVTASYRLAWTAVLMTPVVLGKKECRRELMGANRRTILLCAASGLFLALYFTLWFESLTMTSVVSSTAILCTEVIWVAMGYALFLKGKASLAAVGTIFVTVGGSMFIAPSDYSSGGDHLFGDILALAAVIFCSVHTLIGRQVRDYMSTTTYTYIIYVFCALVLGLATAASGLAFTEYGMYSVMAGLLLSVCPTLLGHNIFSWCLKFLSPSFVSASKLRELAMVALSALFLLNEMSEPLQIMGGAATIGGVLLYSRVEKKENDKKNC